LTFPIKDGTQTDRRPARSAHVATAACHCNCSFIDVVLDVPSGRDGIHASRSIIRLLVVNPRVKPS
jgi:hypothetical protein